jgi:hypothetical protein
MLLKRLNMCHCWFLLYLSTTNSHFLLARLPANPQLTHWLTPTSHVGKMSYLPSRDGSHWSSACFVWHTSQVPILTSVVHSDDILMMRQFQTRRQLTNEWQVARKLFHCMQDRAWIRHVLMKGSHTELVFPQRPIISAVWTVHSWRNDK